MKKDKKQWTYRPTDKEHELLLRAMSMSPEYTSISQFIREAVLRLIHNNDRRKLFAELGEAIDELHQQKEKFLKIVITAMEEKE